MVNQLSLGNFSVAGVEKLAIVTILDDEGKEVAVTNVMKNEKAMKAYRSIIQEILDNHRGYYQLDQHGEIESITFSGITYTKGTPPEASHAAAKTDVLWNKFIHFLRHPQAVGNYRVKVEIFDSDRYERMNNLERFNLLKRALEKRQKEIFGNEQVIYTPDERMALGVFQHKNNPDGLISREEEATLLFNHLENELAPLINTST